MKNLIKLLKKDWKEIKKLDQNRKLILLVLFAVVFVGSIVVGAYIFAPKQLEEFTQSLPIPQQQEEQAVIPTKQPSTDLLVSASSNVLAAGQPQEVSVDLAGLPVSAIDISLTWDENLLEVTDLENGELFEKVILNKVTPGKIRYSASLSPEGQNNASTGKVISFTVTPKNAAAGSEVSLQFDPLETITALNGNNTLGSTTDIVFTVE